MAKRHPNSNSAKVKERRKSYVTVLWLTVPTPRPGGGGTPIHYRNGYVPPNEVVILERGIYFRGVF